jgi:hypothetical protein
VYPVELAGGAMLEQSTHGYQNRSATITVIMVGDIRRTSESLYSVPISVFSTTEKDGTVSC